MKFFEADMMMKLYMNQYISRDTDSTEEQLLHPPHHADKLLEPEPQHIIWL